MNGQSANGRTALIYAVSGKQDLEVKTLLACGADVNHRDKQGRTALTWAAYDGQSNKIVTDLLNAGAQVGLAEALILDDLPKARAILAEHGDITIRALSGMTPLMLAAEKGQADIVQTLLERGADPNAQDDRGSTALMFAVLGEGSRTPTGHTQWSGTREMEARTKIVAMLLDHHADPNLNPYFYHGRHFRNPTTDDIEETALSYAHAVNNLTAVDLLIRHGAKPHAPTLPVKSTL